jgi:homocysteine S-methyltransferase
MAMYREHLPQLAGDVFLTDSGLETDLIFNVGHDLPEFASFPLVDDDAGRVALLVYYRQHVAIAAAVERGIVLEAPTWRASSAWGARLGYDAEALEQVNQTAVALVTSVRGDAAVPVVVSAAIGPQGDGYRPSTYLTVDEARAYHYPQLRTIAATDVDMAHAMTMTYVEEAVGVTEAARDVGLPVAVSFTVETDGALPDGTLLGDAIQRTDDASDGWPVYYGINCAHPTHFASSLDPDASWAPRLRCIRANASVRSHAELDEAEDLDAGDPSELAEQYDGLRTAHPSLTVLGGCCGTDARHVQAIAERCAT